MRTHDSISEQVLLSSIFYFCDSGSNKGIIDEVITELDVEDFGDDNRRKMYSTMVDLRRRGLSVDTVSVISPNVEDENLMREYHQITPMRTTTNIDYLIGNIKAYTAVRGIVEMSHRFNDEVSTGGVEVQDVVEAFMSDINSVNVGRTTKQDYKAEVLASTFFKEFQDRIENKEAVVGLRSGFDTLDKASGGFRGGDLIVIGALPGMGKTSLAISIIAKMVIDGLSPALFTYEMSKLQTQSNIVSAVSCISDRFSTIPRNWIERPLVDNKSWLQSVSEIMGMYVESKGFYADRSIHHRSVSSIRSNCYKLKSEGRLHAVFVDHQGLMIEDFNKERSEIANITGSLKKLAGELDVPVFLLSQMNVRDTKGIDRPVMGMLKGSSTIEADSDTILFPWRPYAINKEGSPTEAQLFIGKSRSFASDDIELVFNEDAICFTEPNDGDIF